MDRLPSLYQTFTIGRTLYDKCIEWYYSSDTSTRQPTQRIFWEERPLLQNVLDLTQPPSQILPRLYLGNAANARDFYGLQERSVGLIINATVEIPDYFPTYFQYKNIRIHDVPGADITPHLDTITYEIHRYLETHPNQTVFVHCFMGASRSASVVLAYLMRYHGVSFIDALHTVKEKRPVVNLNIDFANQLIAYQKKLKSNDLKNLDLN